MDLTNTDQGRNYAGFRLGTDSYRRIQQPRLEIHELWVGMELEFHIRGAET